jgi:FixJ family two-component response regulator
MTQPRNVLGCQAIQEVMERDRRTRQQHADIRRVAKSVSAADCARAGSHAKVVSGLLYKQIASELRIIEIQVVA